jgi:hypothetical protein
MFTFSYSNLKEALNMSNKNNNRREFLAKMMKIGGGLGIGIVTGTSFPLSANADDKFWYALYLGTSGLNGYYMTTCTCQCRTHCYKGCGCICHNDTQIQQSNGSDTMNLGESQQWVGLDGVYSNAWGSSYKTGYKYLFERNYTYNNWP